MGFDLYLAPSDRIDGWDDAAWEKFFASSPEEERLGQSVYVGLVLESIRHNLERGDTGSGFPLVMRIDQDESPYWSLDEVPKLLSELARIRASLGKLPISREALQYDNETDVERRLSEFRQYYPDRPLQTLADLNFYFLDVFERMAKKAIIAGQGLWLSF